MADSPMTTKLAAGFCLVFSSSARTFKFLLFGLGVSMIDTFSTALVAPLTVLVLSGFAPFCPKEMSVG